jgi:hypothetical protein
MSYDTSAIVYKVFFHCREDSNHAFNNGRLIPKEYSKCVAPCMMVGETTEFRDGTISTQDDIKIGQMRTRDNIPCSSGVSPFMRAIYHSNRTYSSEFFADRVKSWHASEGIHAFVNEDDAWRNFN